MKKPHFKPIPAHSNLFKVEYQDGNQSFKYPWHYHPELEITFVLSSSGVRYVGNSVENFHPNDLVLLGPNLPHTWLTSPDESESATAIVIYLKENFLHPSWMESLEFSAIRKLIENMNKGIALHKDAALQLKPKFLGLLDTSDFNRLVLLLEIVHDIANHTGQRLLCEQEFTGALNYTDKERINIVYDYVKVNYQRSITLTDIAGEVNMSEENFSRYFSKTMKKTFFEFLNEYKINTACKLLIETDKQISEICYSAGYESTAFFYKQFKKFKHCQPKEFRSKFQHISQFD